uniref:beta-carotene 3-hydroxylase n=1 Tax=Davidia involucrata TaxID=16924 RepID=A0A5B7CBP5_DAVIN
MAIGIPAASTTVTCRFGQNTLRTPKPNSTTIHLSLWSPVTHWHNSTILSLQKKKSFTICLAKADKIETSDSTLKTELDDTVVIQNIIPSRVAEKLQRKKSERYAYLVAAIMSSLGVTSMALLSVYYRFSWQFEGGEIPFLEMFGTIALSVGAAVGMEFWARWAHRALWHASLWHMHESHHRPSRVDGGPFELNDLFAIINAVPAIALLSYGIFNEGLVPGLCFGAGLGLTVFGMAYMFVHDGLVHRRFPVGPIAHVPYLRKVAAAHQLHHSDRFKGIPYGLFLGPKELEEIGGREELDKEIKSRTKRSKASSSS